jgi:putative solute:sodium symporter small subunit
MPAPPTPPTRQQAYWKSNLRLVTALLIVWFGAGCVLSIFAVEWLNRISLGGFPLGFWMAQQGSIYIFILLILLYAILMDGLDRRYDADGERS